MGGLLVGGKLIQLSWHGGVWSLLEKMANISFLDLMFAEALASGMAREAMRQEKPPPENFFLLPPDPQAWNKIQEASRKENMVVCVEFTDNRNENCKAVQRLFMDLAREFEGIPFVRAVIGPGTYDKVRKEWLDPSTACKFVPATSLQEAFPTGYVLGALYYGEGVSVHPSIGQTKCLLIFSYFPICFK